MYLYFLLFKNNFYTVLSFSNYFFIFLRTEKTISDTFGHLPRLLQKLIFYLFIQSYVPKTSYKFQRRFTLAIKSVPVKIGQILEFVSEPQFYLIFVTLRCQNFDKINVLFFQTFLSNIFIY